MSVYSIVTETTLVIDGKQIPAFHSLTLQQSIHSTHEFRILFEHDAVEDLVTLFSDQLEQLHRKTLEITVAGDPSTASLEFKGVITRTELRQRDDGYWGQMTLIGHGHGEALRTVPGTQTFIDKSIADVVTESLTGYQQTKKISAPAGPAKLPFCVRYHESIWDFIKRLAYDFGAWFYYDGNMLHFTTSPGSATPLTLTFGANLIHFRSGVRAVPTYFKHYDYLPEEDRRLETETGSDELPYGKPADDGVISPHPAQATADLTPYRDNRKATLSAEEKYLEGQTRVPGLYPGCKIVVKDAPNGKGGQSVPYLVTDVVHYGTGVGQYHNRFRAIPADTVAMPARKLLRPVAQTQIGEVVDNKDPKGMGRVKVRMLWMSAPQTTPFIRMTLPHFGLHADNKKTRGFQFVPAVGDQVMVGFEHNDPERPFVIGALPHGKNSSIDPNKPEEEKHISVGSGSTLTFIEKPAAKEIHLKVDENNFVSISVANGTGTVTVQSSKDILVKGQSKITFDAPEIELSGMTIALNAKQALTIKGPQLTMEASGKLSLKGTAADVEGTGMLTVKSTGITTVKGATVLIN